MYIIAGLGNPEKRYAGTRHNIGFAAVNRLAEKHNIIIGNEEKKALTGRGIINGEKVMIAMPLTYMNASGEAVASLANFYKIDIKDELIIVYDDIDLDPGKLRIRQKSSAGGHNGMKSIIKCLGTDDFPRVRIGVGAKPAGWDLADHVLSKFDKDTIPVMDQALDRACEAIETIIRYGTGAAMNKYN
ncbi:MAG: aminoacyl-tRNA hydrolase [Lachnospiraceae bacterium]|jgi:PTH1 family peptidyl-tRNA hydrolase|nr:aminoacyl-tRNA hydrolase [Lachnospiraceae bacterium]MEE3460771.1 aminoacyl-tRNA hydrolase [Lachnospiraceae bacterium]